MIFIRRFSTATLLKFPRKVNLKSEEAEESLQKWRTFVKTPLTKSEQFVTTDYGLIRYDSENEPTVHGEFDYDIKKPEEEEEKHENEENLAKVIGKKTQLNFDTDPAGYFLETQPAPSESIPELLPKQVERKEAKKDDFSLEPKTMAALKYVKMLRNEMTLRKSAEQSVKLNKEEEIRLLGKGLQARLVPVVSMTAFSEKSKVELNDEETKDYLFGRVNPKFLPMDLSKLTSTEVVTQLERTLIYNNNDFVAINKPFGLEMFGDNLQHSVEKYLPALAKFVGCDTLYQVHRLDKNTSGVLLLAKNQEMHGHLANLFRTRKMHKVYWTITNGTPNPDCGLIKIPLVEARLDGRFRMTVQPDYKSNSSLVSSSTIKAKKLAKLAVTEYTALKSKGNAALLQVNPKTGVKHQIRAHLGFGLGTPVLGDHKYSDIQFSGKPQKIHGDILKRLKVREAKGRDLPILLHAHSISIPEILDRNDIYLKAKLPFHFVKIMKALGLAPK